MKQFDRGPVDAFPGAWPLDCLLLTLVTSLLAGTISLRPMRTIRRLRLMLCLQTFQLLYRNPAMLLTGLPFALTLLTILLVHELGHYYACRHHHIHASYPFFIPAPTLIGTFGAFILIRSPIRSTRALFDVGASGPLVGFHRRGPRLAFGVLHAKVIPAFGGSTATLTLSLACHLFCGWCRQSSSQTLTVSDLLLHPVGRAAWVGLFATALNLLPVGQLDGGHILRSVSPRLHRWVSLLLPISLIPLGIFQWHGWLIWAVLLFGLRFFRTAPLYDPTPLDPNRRFAAVLAFAVFVLCFMPAPL